MDEQERAYVTKISNLLFTQTTEQDRKVLKHIKLTPMGEDYINPIRLIRERPTLASQGYKTPLRLKSGF